MKLNLHLIVAVAAAFFCGAPVVIAIGSASQPNAIEVQQEEGFLDRVLKKRTRTPKPTKTPKPKATKAPKPTTRPTKKPTPSRRQINRLVNGGEGWSEDECRLDPSSSRCMELDDYVCNQSESELQKLLVDRTADQATELCTYVGL